MADYGEVTVRGKFSRNSDVAEPETDTGTISVSLTPDNAIHLVTDIATSAKTLVGAGEWTTCQCLIVKNNDATNFVTVGYTDAAADAQTIDVVAGGIFVTTDVDPSVAVTVTSDTAACECEIFIAGTT